MRSRARDSRHKEVLAGIELTDGGVRSKQQWQRHHLSLPLWNVSDPLHGPSGGCPFHRSIKRGHLDGGRRRPASRGSGSVGR
jgi:hypothetical protein